MGGLESGASQKALATFNQNLANKTFDTYYGDLERQGRQGLNAANMLGNSNLTTAAGLSGVAQGTSDRLSLNRTNNTTANVGNNNYTTTGLTTNNNNFTTGMTVNNNNYLSGLTTI
jgi:hypothetical protein